MAQREVLIVAHDHHVGRVLNELFLVGGYQCLVAGSGREGLEAFRRSRPPLIVTDVNLPLMSGGQRVARAGAFSSFPVANGFRTFLNIA